MDAEGVDSVADWKRFDRLFPVRSVSPIMILAKTMVPRPALEEVLGDPGGEVILAQVDRADREDIAAFAVSYDVYDSCRFRVDVLIKSGRVSGNAARAARAFASAIRASAEYMGTVPITRFWHLAEVVSDCADLGPEALQAADALVGSIWGSVYRDWLQRPVDMSGGPSYSSEALDCVIVRSAIVALMLRNIGRAWADIMASWSRENVDPTDVWLDPERDPPAWRPILNELEVETRCVAEQFAKLAGVVPPKAG